MRTSRRLDDPIRFYGLSWRGWLGVAAAGGLLYAFVQLSPLGPQATISLALIALVLPAMALSAASGQALGAGRYLAAACGWLLRSRTYTHNTGGLPTGGVMLDQPPPAPTAGRSPAFADQLLDQEPADA